MRRLLIPVLSLLFVIGIMAVSFLGQPVNKDDFSRLEFMIAPGEGLDQIALDLSDAKLIRSRTIFKFTVFRLNLAKKIQAGYFLLSPSQSVSQIAQSLTKASQKQAWVTVTEGLRREEVANHILDQLTESGIDHDYDPEEFLRLTTRLEGRLFPDTYAFAPGVTTSQILEKFNARFGQIVETLNIKEEDLHRVVTLASLVEREAGNDSERPEVAAIISKRIAADWPLQIDATVQYAVASSRCRIRICDWWPESLTRADLAIVSPYNTYLNPGLPPGPIGNPGRASLEASVNPKETKYWFYLHDTDGKIHYATTIEEHNANVCTYLKIDCP